MSIHSVMSNSLWIHGLQPTGLLCPWDSPGKNIGVGFHFLLQKVYYSALKNKEIQTHATTRMSLKAIMLSKITQSQEERKLYNYMIDSFPGGSIEVKNQPAMQETWVRSLGQEDPLEKEMATHSSIFAWRIPWTEKPCRQQCYSSWGHKELDTTEKLSTYIH